MVRRYYVIHYVTNDNSQDTLGDIKWYKMLRGWLIAVDFKGRKYYLNLNSVKEVKVIPKEEEDYE